MITHWTCPDHPSIVMTVSHQEPLRGVLGCPLLGCGRTMTEALDKNLSSAIGNAAEFAESTTQPFDGRYPLQFIQELARQGYQVVELP